jgi:hypothetical protein
MYDESGKIGTKQLNYVKYVDKIEEKIILKMSSLNHISYGKFFCGSHWRGWNPPPPMKNPLPSV